jgi:phosphoribosylglycinamide formyltransferase 1
VKVAILISGGGSNMVELVRSMTGDHPARPALVLSNVPGAGGLARAEALGVPTAVVPSRGRPREEFEAELGRAIAGVDLVCLAGFMRILSPAFVGPWAGRMLNIHPSLLPLYPGLDTHARALAAGNREAGCTVHDVTADLDMGPVRGQARVPVEPGDTPETLAARVLTAEHVLYPLVLRRRATGDARPVLLPSPDVMA